MIIGIVGRNCAGKDTVAEILVAKGFRHRSLSKIIRDEATAQGMSQDRAGLIELANELRRKEGPAVLAERTIKKVDQDHEWVLSSIRHPKEVAVLRSLEGFTLWKIVAPPETRYARSQARGLEAPVSFEEFKALEEKENQTSGDDVQRVSDVEALADATIINDGSVAVLRTRVEELL